MYGVEHMLKEHPDSQRKPAATTFFNYAARVLSDAPSYMQEENSTTLFTPLVKGSTKLDQRKCFIYDTLNTFYLCLCGIRYMIKDHSDSERGNSLPVQGRKEEGNVLFNDALNTLFTVIWRQTHRKGPIQIAREETRCHHMGYSFRLAERVLLYVPSHRQDNTYHILCYTSRGALVGTRNSPMGPPHEGSIRRPIAP